LLDYTGRLFRDGKAMISAELTGILERLGSSAESWRARLEKLKSGLRADSSPSVESGCDMSPHNWACIIFHPSGVSCQWSVASDRL